MIERADLKCDNLLNASLRVLSSSSGKMRTRGSLQLAQSARPEKISRRNLLLAPISSLLPVVASLVPE